MLASRRSPWFTISWPARLGLLACLSLCAWAVGQAAPDGPDEIAGMEAIRGNVVKVTGSTYLVKAPGGTDFKIETGVNTHFVRDGESASAGSIHPGDFVLAGGELDQKQHTLGAVFLAAVDPRQLAEFDRRRTEFGKTWLAGTITAIHGTELTVRRPDDQVAKVTVDENTSFRKRHESITLGDIQVGDGMTARGAMQKGLFAGSVITVVDAREIREWSKLRAR